MSTEGERRLIVGLVGAVLGAAWLSWWFWPADRADVGAGPRPAGRPAPQRLGAPPSGGEDRDPVGGPADASVAEREAVCTPRVGRRCSQGDVYWIDGCGRRGDKQAECGARLCRDDRCQRGDESACDGLPLEGTCDGDIVRGCVGGKPYARDCRDEGRRCVITDEGAVCRRPSPRDCEHHGELPRCEGDRLLLCVDGRLFREDCGAQGALCGELPGDGSPSCHVIERLEGPPDEDAECGPCGCDPVRDPEAVDGCDGQDNDGDQLIDEDEPCEPIPILAVVVTDGAGRSSYARADLEAEIERVNRVLASAPEGLGLSAELLDVVHVARPGWLVLDDEGFSELMRDPAMLAARDTFHVPVVFTDEIESGGAPKAGVSTLPNGRCGGRRINPSPEPPLGAIAVAKGRAPTTVAHELGHFLGLCHTHFDYGRALARVVRYPLDDGRLAQLRCSPACRLDGDGICDTPIDPGPEACAYDQACRVQCRAPSSAAPDPFNVMSYYTACRRGLTDLQALELRRGLGLRRGFFRCRSPALCPCDPHASSCPEQMTCRPGPVGFACGLDGPQAPGQPCAHHAECGDGAVCASDGSCRLPCGAEASTARGDVACQCTRDARLGLAVCL